MFARILISIFLLCFCFLCADAQADRGFSFSDTVADVTVNQYTSARDQDLLLYNGAEYAHSYPHTTGHPFFLTDTFQRSSLVYDGVLYRNVPLAYDITNNAIAIKNKDNFLIELVFDKVDSFLFKDHFFISLTRGNLPRSGILSPGIYEMYRYSDSVAVLIRHQKYVIRAGNAADLDRFKSIDDYFIRVNGKDYAVSNNNTLSAPFASRSNEVKNYVRQHHLNVRRQQEDILEITGYYAQLNR